METAFVSIICVALMVIGGMTMSQGFLSSVDSTTNNIQTLSHRDEDIMRTNITVLSASQTAANTLLVTVKNNGQTKLSSFEKWDVIIHSEDASAQKHVSWLPYDGVSPGNNEWYVDGIYQNAADKIAEVFEPGILNPDEEAVFKCQIDPPVGAGTVNLVSVSTPNGVTVSKAFNGYQP
jgi:archaellum component FlaF (FlaF/FlaG flagellin family)